MREPAQAEDRVEHMRAYLLLLCIFGLTGCGLAKRFIPRPTPRVIITGGHLFSYNDMSAPCTMGEADTLLAAYYGQGIPARMPS